MKLLKILCLSLLVLKMASVASALNIGDEAPGFSLQNAEGKEVKLSDFKGKTVVLEWTNHGCPYVKKHYNSGHIQKLQASYREKGVVWLVINSTNSEHSDFLTPEKREAFTKEKNLSGKDYLTDAEGVVGKAYGAKTTPHLFVVKSDGKLGYQGALDDAPMGDPSIAKNYVADALDELLAGKSIMTAEVKAYGCSVKY